jgi:glycerol-3-phosphate cytidylyltransferase
MTEKIMRKMLFIDDRISRIHGAIDQYGIDYDLTFATCAREALRLIARQDFYIISMDCDLNGEDFVDPDSHHSGMDIVRYLEKTGWPHGKPKPKFIIHSSNILVANLAYQHLTRMGFDVFRQPFGWKPYQRGCVAGAFDVIHLGYVRLLKDAKKQCHHLTVLLHDKPGQIFSIETRREIVLGMKGVDEVIIYKSEEELTELLKNFDIRIVGSDHIEHSTRCSMNIPTYYHKRNHTWCATDYKLIIHDFMKGNVLE